MMKIGKKLESMINKQINAEFYSAYLYLSMAAYFDSMNLGGFSNWMRVQAKEELGHGMKFYKFVYERGGVVKLDGIQKPKSEWNGPLTVFEEAYAHEVEVTKMINELFEVAKSEKDSATQVFLGWFIDEQVEEEASADAIVQKIKMVGEKGNALILLDHELAKRGEGK